MIAMLENTLLVTFFLSFISMVIAMFRVGSVLTLLLTLQTLFLASILNHIGTFERLLSLL